MKCRRKKRISRILVKNLTEGQRPTGKKYRTERILGDSGRYEKLCQYHLWQESERHCQEGGSSDARNASKIAGKHIFKEMYE